MPAYHPDYAVTEDSTWDGGGWATNVVYSESNVSFSAKQGDQQMRLWSVVLDWLAYAPATAWQGFFDSRNGSYDPFYWWAWYKTSGDQLPVAIGDGSTTTFDLPYKQELAHPLVYVATLLQTEGVDYTFAAGAGAGGDDRVVFGSAPSNGDAITASSTNARTRHLVRFKTDSYPQTKFSYRDGGIAAQFAYQLEEVITGA